MDENRTDENKSSESANDIETQYLVIYGYLFKMGDLVLNIRNISEMSTSNLRKPIFPTYAKNRLIAACCVAVVAFLCSSMFPRNSALFIFASVCALIYAGINIKPIWEWHKEVKLLEQSKFLNIKMASGSVYRILFADKSYIPTFRNKFDNIFAKGGEKNISYKFDTHIGQFVDNKGNINADSTIGSHAAITGASYKN